MKCSHHQGRRGTLADLVDGHLAAAGLVDVAQFVGALNRAAGGINAEIWLMDAGHDDGDAWRPVGMASLLIDDRYRTAEFFIYIGESLERGRGTGTAATMMVLDWGFHITALRCIHLAVLAQNTGAIHAYEKAGFRTVGTRRRTGSWLGQPADEVIMDAIPEEYPGPRLVEAAVLDG